jgi:hypothetical protein
MMDGVRDDRKAKGGCAERDAAAHRFVWADGFTTEGSSIFAQQVYDT